MGEVQEILIGGNGMQSFPVGLLSDYGGYQNQNQSLTTVNEKIYVIEGTGVRVFDKSTNTWEVPTVLGMEPTNCKGHSAALVNEDRILVLKQESTHEDCIWFLEVDTPFVRDQRKILHTEVVAWSKGVIGNGPKPVVISGPSGVGKGTLIDKLMNEYPSMFGLSVSHTTRAPRKMEKDGVHYHFTERSAMEEEIRGGKFLETAAVHGNLYGTSIEAVEVVTDSGKICILDIDVQGARSVQASCLEALFIFICPPSFEELEKRLRTRGTETEEQVQKRLRNAIKEIKEGESSGLFDHILVNDDLNRCYENLKELLGLNGKQETLAYQPCLEKCQLATGHCISETDHKVLIQCGTIGQGKSSKDFVLDVSSLKGGAPGRTRGLKICASDPFANGGHNGFKEIETQ